MVGAFFVDEYPDSGSTIKGGNLAGSRNVNSITIGKISAKNNSSSARRVIPAVAKGMTGTDLLDRSISTLRW